MGNEKIYRKFIPVHALDIAGLETWLSDLAEKGFFLYEFSAFFGLFTVGEPKKVRYRLEPVGEDVYYPEFERNQLYKASGWHFVATYKKRFYVYQAEDEAAPELHTDPVIQSATLKKLEQNLLRALISGLLLVAVLAIENVVFALRGNLLSNVLLRYHAVDYIMFLLWLLACAFQISRVVGVSRLRRRLRAGEPFEHLGNYHFGAVQRAAEGILLLGLVVTMVVIIVQNNSASLNTYTPVAGSGSSLAKRLAEAELAADPALLIDSAGHNAQASPLAPVQYIVETSGSEGEGFKPHMQIYYYETALAFLAGPLYNELVKEYCGKDGQALPSDRLEGAVYRRFKGYRFSDIQVLLAHNGNRVLVLRYEGTADLKEALAQVTGLLAGPFQSP